ncbi:alpha/beta hydrolase [Flavobacterium selenitireducens]|uniref:alpha/beta hydrolase n=1 Tax=Flavobacterium selenitireducens TaxID=2722704 RepID=UPI00168BE623|nr:alpha/beta hydrolase [Flavobacterium selenitireducens]MBD3581469.1 alpha/beta hydrolase [Flavobacterium selenitireducens]
MKLYIALLFFVASQSSCAQQDFRNLKYGEEAQQNLDLFLPVQHDRKTPVVLMLHGGAWSLGGKEYTDKTARDLRDRGFVVANIDYRYVSEKISAKDLLDDIALAETLMRQLSAKHRFASAEYHVSGISAGAHLAMLYAYTRNSGVKSVAVLCGPTQFDTKENQAHIERMQLAAVVEKLANSSYKKDEQPNAAFTAISPYARIKNIPTLLFHGDKDDLVLYSQATVMRNALEKAGVKNELVTMTGKGHDCGMNQPDSEKVVLDKIENWVKRYN